MTGVYRHICVQQPSVRARFRHPDLFEYLKTMSEAQRCLVAKA